MAYSLELLRVDCRGRLDRQPHPISAVSIFCQTCPLMRLKDRLRLSGPLFFLSFLVFGPPTSMLVFAKVKFQRRRWQRRNSLRDDPSGEVPIRASSGMNDYCAVVVAATATTSCLRSLPSKDFIWMKCFRTNSKRGDQYRTSSLDRGGRRTYLRIRRNANITSGHAQPLPFLWTAACPILF